MNRAYVLIEKSLYSKHTEQSLERLVLEFSAKKGSKNNIYKVFHGYHKNEHETKRYLKMAVNFGDHPVELILDRLCGWCREDLALLPNETVDKP